jgi:hypothetical protein
MFKKLFGSLVILAFSIKATAQVGKPSHHLRYPISIKTIPATLYTAHLSPVCKAEVILQKKTGLPIYIRLGGKEYVDYLEGKPNAVRRW